MSLCVSSVITRSWMARARATRSCWAESDAASAAATAVASMRRFMEGAMLLWSAPSAMTRYLYVLAFTACVAAPMRATTIEAQADVTGEWDASYATPLGPQELKIYLTQEGPRISGHTTSEYGESQVRGTINGADIAFTFEATDGGKAVVIRVTAKVEGARMRGTAKIGDRADGAFSAERSD